MNQDTIQIINEIFQVCIIPLIGILTTYLVKYISKKAEQIAITTDSVIVRRYIELSEKAIIDAVKATNQTFVDSLKDKNLFDENAQKQAYEMTKSAVLASLSDSAKEFLKQIYGDFDTWLDIAIQTAVGDNKLSSKKMA